MYVPISCGIIASEAVKAMGREGSRVIEVTIDSVRVSLTSPHRVVILKDVNRERYLPIWIGSFEADAITIELQGIAMPRPLTHDLLKNVIHKIGGEVSHVLVNDLREDTFYAQIAVDVNGKHLEIDSRPSDALALAVRVGVPIFVAESVMDRASITPKAEEKAGISKEEEKKLSVFRDFIETLDMGGLTDD